MLEIKRNINLKKILIDRGIKQYEIANVLGIDESLISKHINGARELREEIKEKLAKLINIKKEDI